MGVVNTELPRFVTLADFAAVDRKINEAYLRDAIEMLTQSNPLLDGYLEGYVPPPWYVRMIHRLGDALIRLGQRLGGDGE